MGILALASGSGAVYRMLGAGKRSTRAAARGQRADGAAPAPGAMRPIPRCTALAGGTATRPGNVTETWTVTGAGTSARPCGYGFAIRRRGARRADTLFTTLPCD